ncbi:MAG TPA: hypothetical protein VNV66_21610 [Pilimelia sp.]|nr:hypothetical protein [Pilimelia sp.]
MAQLRRIVDSWRERELRLRSAFVAQMDPGIGGARRLAYLLYGDWTAADDAVRRAVRAAVPRWWRPRRSVTPVEEVLGDAVVRGYLAPARLPWPDPGRATHPPGVRPLLMTTLDDLSPRQRAVLVCRHYRRLDQAATAALVRATEMLVAAELMAATGIVGASVDRLRAAAAAGDDRGFVVVGEVVDAGGSTS